jgi:hypothetical protein
LFVGNALIIHGADRQNPLVFDLRRCGSDSGRDHDLSDIGQSLNQLSEILRNSGSPRAQRLILPARFFIPGKTFEPV